MIAVIINMANARSTLLKPALILALQFQGLYTYIQGYASVFSCRVDLEYPGAMCYGEIDELADQASLAAHEKPHLLKRVGHRWGQDQECDEGSASLRDTQTRLNICPNPLTTMSLRCSICSLHAKSIVIFPQTNIHSHICRRQWGTRLLLEKARHRC